VPALTRSEVAAYALCAVVVALLGIRALRTGPAPAPTPAALTAGPDHGPGPDGAASRGAEAAGVEVVVHVVGAVRRPGLYTLERGDRIADALRRAGGASSAAELTGLNLAAKLADGQQVVVPREAASGAAVPPASGAAAPPAGAGGAAPAAPVSLSTATQEQLEALDGVGPGLAAKILEVRQAKGGFSSVEDLADVPGIGEKRLEALRRSVQP
jgi:competence protein ComEA